MLLLANDGIITHKVRSNANFEVKEQFDCTIVPGNSIWYIILYDVKTDVLHVLKCYGVAWESNFPDKPRLTNSTMPAILILKNKTYSYAENAIRLLVSLNLLIVFFSYFPLNSHKSSSSSLFLVVLYIRYILHILHVPAQTWYIYTVQRRAIGVKKTTTTNSTPNKNDDESEGPSTDRYYTRADFNSDLPLFGSAGAPARLVGLEPLASDYGCKSWNGRASDYSGVQN